MAAQVVDSLVVLAVELLDVEILEKFLIKLEELETHLVTHLHKVEVVEMLIQEEIATDLVAAEAVELLVETEEQDKVVDLVLEDQEHLLQ